MINYLFQAVCCLVFAVWNSLFFAPRIASLGVPLSRLHSLTTSRRQLVVDVTTGVPELVWFGRPLSGELNTIDLLNDRSIANANLANEAPATVLPVESDGWVGQPGIDGRRTDGSAWSPRFEFASCENEDEATLVCTGNDPRAQLTAVTRLTLGLDGVVTINIELRNDGESDDMLNRMSVTIPVSPEITELQVPEGRWVHEFHEVRLPWRVGAIEITNRRGRTSHDKPPWVFAGQAAFTNETGRVWGAHLGWSGNAAVRAEVLTDGRRVLQLGEVLLGDELRVGPGESYVSPKVYLAWSDEGMNGVSRSFHRHLRGRPNHPKPTSPRPVHMNTWEAVYFNHDLDTLKALADRAADVGAERYVLDDGWFHGRRNDSTGLGDWWVDSIVWPDGLEPIIDHVTELGMEFGIWVEPEMVNPDSDLYRTHPDWALGVPGYEPILARNQLLLDLTKNEVFNYLFEHLDRLLADHDISYLKWDMNRDLTQPASGERAAAHAQTLAVYRLIDSLRANHPGVDIESCSSGGARADYGILERTDRVWTSDSNDALERQRIQSGFMRLFPPEVMGAHVGPGRSHTSGRRHSLGFRATSAFFGHFGIEWNLLEASDSERAQLAEVVTLHKRHRELLHSGTVWHVDAADPGLHIVGIVATDQTEALFSVAQLLLARNATPERIRFPGLDEAASYDVSLILLADTVLGRAIYQPAWTRDPARSVPGDVLSSFGVQLPALDPESAVLIHLEQR